MTMKPFQSPNNLCRERKFDFKRSGTAGRTEEIAVFHYAMKVIVFVEIDIVGVCQGGKASIT
jgi:hypothetical protein